MSHPVITKRNKEIKKEFEALYKKKYLNGELYVEEILADLGKKYNLAPETIRKIVNSK